MIGPTLANLDTFKTESLNLGFLQGKDLSGSIDSVMTRYDDR